MGGITPEATLLRNGFLTDSEKLCCSELHDPVFALPTVLIPLLQAWTWLPVLCESPWQRLLHSLLAPNATSALTLTPSPARCPAGVR
ncbi:hypothetical protein AV530_000270 [Patagioenas fasciata monilis]|uniref:Uncharacterized protein n=1 Tax=Patagioenas fasciata monilis TaxID=372326 RepID=A0A1V4KD67_PATFA|nr:hypothetical protein AV530_000270 [Patagioenas fasciata monilis]